MSRKSRHISNFLKKLKVNKNLNFKKMKRGISDVEIFNFDSTIHGPYTELPNLQSYKHVRESALITWIGWNKQIQNLNWPTQST